VVSSSNVFDRLMLVLPKLSPAGAAYLMAGLRDDGIPVSPRPEGDVDKLKYYLAAPTDHASEPVNVDTYKALQLIESYRIFR
jgi:hypothetical protein